LPGRRFDSFTVNGIGDLVLENLNENRLNVSLRGEGDVRASATGVVGDLTLSIAESGDADMVNSPCIRQSADRRQRQGRAGSEG
jgi:hypothetical protein